MLGLATAQGNWEVASKIEENHVCHDVNEAALMRGAYNQHKLENILYLPHCETKSGVWRSISSLNPRSHFVLNHEN